MTEQGESDYRRGQRSAWRRVLHHALQELHYDQESSTVEDRLHRMIAEREDAIATLRRLCDDYGDNDWPDDLHLSDVIDKHLDLTSLG